jgi:hypothetical protein|tara:strand:- start:40 stop:378 length:339 start_codon:yes stop_codon:yes gene_type:complete
MTSLLNITHSSTITIGEIIDISNLIQTSNGDAYVTKVVCDTGDIVSIWRNDEDAETPALKGLAIGDEVGMSLDIKISPDLATGKQVRKVYGKPIKLARATAFIAAQEAQDNA